MDSCNCSKWDNWELDVAVIICNKSIRPSEESQGKQDLSWLKKKKKYTFCPGGKSGEATISF